MAIHITDECINCGACEPECPNNAIYEPGAKWAMMDGTKLEGIIQIPSLGPLDAALRQKPISDEIYYIVPDKCTECVGFHEEPQCAAVCPVECCLPDPEKVEDKESLQMKQHFLHKIV